MKLHTSEPGWWRLASRGLCLALTVFLLVLTGGRESWASVGQQTTPIGVSSVSSASQPLFLPIVVSGVAGNRPAVPECQTTLVDDPDNVDDAPTICSGQPVRGAVGPEDMDDVYRIEARVGDKIQITVDGQGGDVDLFLYPPGTRDVDTVDRDAWAAVSNRQDGQESLAYVATQSGYWYVDIFAFKGQAEYVVIVSVPAGD